MPRAGTIYVVDDELASGEERYLACFTVKHEALRWLERRRAKDAEEDRHSQYVLLRLPIGHLMGCHFADAKVIES